MLVMAQYVVSLGTEGHFSARVSSIDWDWCKTGLHDRRYEFIIWQNYESAKT